MQGEGPSLGRRALFVRFGECDLRCAWCDSPGTWRPAAECRIEQAAGSGEFRSVPNPVAAKDVRAAADALELERHHHVALTGGEPLLQAEAVRAVAEALGGRGAEILLETHGLAVAALERVVDRIDCVSMDWKLASDVRRAGDAKGAPVADFHDTHQAFLRVALGASSRVVKFVVTPASGDAELEAAWARIRAVDPATPVVLQPVTPFAKVTERPSAGRMLALLRRAQEDLEDVRVIPQTHPIWGAR